MEISMIILCLLPSVITSITVSSNGNSPEIKLIGGMMVDAQRGFVPVSPMPKLEERTAKSKNKINTTKLSINERYRRLIPYMTFYYANDLVVPTTEAHTTKSLVEVEKVEIVEASALDKTNQREAKKILYTPHRNIPRYQGNRLTQFNIASANPAHIYKEAIPTHQNIARVTTNFNPLIKEQNILTNHDYGRFVQKPIVKSPSVPFSLPTRKPYLNIQHNEDTANVPYYLSDKEFVPKFKLVPYEQTPPVKFVSENDNIYDSHKIPIPVPVLIPKEQVYIKPRPASPQYVYDNVNNQEQVGRKPATISESYYDKRPHGTLVQPVIEGGFRPIVNPFLLTTEAPIYTSTVLETSSPRFESQKQHPVQVVETATAALQVKDNRASYYPFKVANPPINEEPTYRPSTVPSNTITLGDLLNSLQLSKSIPKPITRENVGSSIRTLLQVLNALKTTPQQNEVEAPVLSTPQPFVAPEVVVEVAPKQVETTPAPFADPELHHEPYLAPVNIPSQHIDDIRTSGGTTQQFPLPVTSDDEGGTPGRPGVDYPVLTTIPHTSFNCKTQRYKGFFADPETRCQVWHYCDLNGGQASFLCPNGTIFSQAALTCDWWFNVRCASTTQLYVLNESLYKYILPHTPKFPEDYSGPLVDKYLTLKFKEMEEQFKKNKNKQKAKEKIDSDETEDSSDEESEKNLEKNDTDSGKSDGSTVSEASVNVQTSGSSGNVERLRD